MAKEKEAKSKAVSRAVNITNLINKIDSGDFSSEAKIFSKNNEVNAIDTYLNKLAEELAGRFIKKDYIERRVNTLLDTLKKAAAGNLKASSPLEGKNDVFDALAAGTNMMIEEIERSMRQISQEKLYIENIISSLVDTLILVDPEGKIKTVNRETCELLGYKEDELIGKPVAKIFAEEEEEEEEEEVSIFKGTGLEKLIEEGRIRDYEMTYRTKWGEDIPVSFSGSVMRNEKNEIMGIVGIARDMREMKRLQEKEREAAGEKVAEEILENLPEGVVLLDLNGNVLKVNYTANRMLGYRETQVGGYPAIRFIAERDVPQGLEMLKRFKKTGLSETFECHAVRRDGTEFPVSVEASFLRDNKGNPKQIMITFREITELKRAEEERTAAMLEKAVVIDAMLDSVIVLNLDGQITSVNPAHLKMFGHKSADEILRVGFEGFKERLSDPEKDLPLFLGLFKEIIEKGFIEEPIELRLRRVDGTGLIASASGSLLRDAKGNPKNVVAVLRDISELKKAQEEATKAVASAAAAEMAAVTIEGMAEAVVLTNLDGIFSQVNSEFERTTGWKREEVVGKAAFELGIISKKEVQKIKKEVSPKLMKEGSVRNIETTSIRKDGTSFPILLSMALIKDAEGKTTGIITASGDITERKQAEEALRESEEKLRSILASSPSAITVTDLNGNVAECNQMTLDMHEYPSKDEVIGKSAFMFIAKKDQQKAMENMKKTLKQGSIKNIEYTLLTKGGREFIAELSASVIKDSSGNPICFMAITRDITERKLIEKEIKKLNEELKTRAAQLEEANKEMVEAQNKLVQAEKISAVGRLGAGVAHEINNPLGVILMNTQMLLEKLDKNDSSPSEMKNFKNMLKRVEEATVRCKKISSDLLEFARISEPQLIPLDINEVVDEALSLVENLLPLDKIKIVKKYDYNMPQILGDPAKIRQVFLNLIINAKDAMPAGGTLRIVSKKDENYLSIEFADTGCGISQKNLDKIFDPFFTTKSDGSGLGLSVSHSIVESHNGYFSVESKKDKGTTLRIFIPISPPTYKEFNSVKGVRKDGKRKDTRS